MNYKLAKQLKDAGYLFRKVKDCQGEGCLEYMAKVINFNDGFLYLPPILEELIDACGDEFIELRKAIDEPIWLANGVGKRGIKRVEAKTPSESVAKLWLKLNK